FYRGIHRPLRVFRPTERNTSHDATVGRIGGHECLASDCRMKRAPIHHQRLSYAAVFTRLAHGLILPRDDVQVLSEVVISPDYLSAFSSSALNSSSVIPRTRASISIGSVSMPSRNVSTAEERSG